MSELKVIDLGNIRESIEKDEKFWNKVGRKFVSRLNSFNRNLGGK